MAEERKLNIVLGARDAASKGINKVKGSLGTLEGKVVAVAAAWGTWKVATQMFKSTVLAAAEEEAQINRLRNAVELTGDSWEDAKPKIDDFLRSMQDTTKFGDDTMRPALQKMVNLTGNLDTAMEGAKLAADLAASGLFDLNTASRYMAQAIEGEVTVLGRYIPELKSSAGLIKENMTAQEKWAVASDLIRKKFGGMAKGELNTFQGRLEQLKNELGDLGQAIGKYILPALTDMIKFVTGVIKPLTAFIDLLGSEEIGDIRDEFKAFADRLSDIYERSQYLVELEELRQEHMERTIELQNMLKDAQLATADATTAWGKSFGEVEAKSNQMLFLEQKLIEEDERFKQAMDELTEKYKQRQEAAREAVETEIEQEKSKTDIINELYGQNYDLAMTYLTTWEEEKQAQIQREKVALDALSAKAIEIMEFQDQLAQEEIERRQGVIDFYMMSESEKSAAIINARLREMAESGKYTKKQLAEYAKLAKAQIQMSRQVEAIVGAGFQRLGDSMVDTLFGAKIKFGDIFRDMAKDFLKLFVQQILQDVKLALVAKLINMLRIFDRLENDRMAIQMGRDYARLFQQGVFEQMNLSAIAGSLAGGASIPIGMSAPTVASGGTNVINLTVINPIGTEEFVRSNLVPALERAIERKESSIMIEGSI